MDYCTFQVYVKFPGGTNRAMRESKGSVEVEMIGMARRKFPLVWAHGTDGE